MSVFTAPRYTIARYMLWPSVRLSVRPSVRPSQAGTAKRRITQATPHDSPGTLSFLMSKISGKFECDPSNEGAKYRLGRLKSATSTNTSLYFRNDARYARTYYGRHTGTRYVLYRTVLFPVTLSHPQTTPISTFCVAFHIFITARERLLKFGS